MSPARVDSLSVIRSMDLPFYTLDVFSDTTFGGNPLGVFPDAAHLPTDLMQRIALEMNLSETVFLGPPESGGTARVRIFTPGREVPFAGHPTVGTGVFLANRSGPPEEIGAGGSGTTSLVLEENIGPVPVQVRYESGVATSAEFETAILPEHRPNPHPLEDVAALISLSPDDLGAIGPGGRELGVEQVSCGLEYFIIPVRSIDAARRSFLDLGLWRSMLADAWAHHVYVVAMDGEGDSVDVHVRMYAPGSGVPEDPATGSAAAALGGYLSAADGREEANLSWVVEQGIEMGRPSLIRVGAERRGGKTARVTVGGAAVPVSQGTMTVS